MQAATEVGLKEWASICARLGDGRQSLLLRKGGIHERRPALGAAPAFALEHREFCLLPTYFHAREPGRARDLVPAAQEELPRVLAEAPPPGALRVELFARVEAAHEVHERERLRGLDGMHAWSDACVDDRFGYRKPGLWVLVLRTYRLRQAILLPDLAEYAGCVSWVHLARAVEGEADPALSDAEHAERTLAVAAALGAA